MIAKFEKVVHYALHARKVCVHNNNIITTIICIFFYCTFSIKYSNAHCKKLHQPAMLVPADTPPVQSGLGRLESKPILCYNDVTLMTRMHSRLVCIHKH